MILIAVQSQIKKQKAIFVGLSKIKCLTYVFGLLLKAKQNIDS